MLSVVHDYKEPPQRWSDVLKGLRGRGMSRPKLVVGDGYLGIWGALGSMYPDAKEQR